MHELVGEGSHPGPVDVISGITVKNDSDPAAALANDFSMSVPTRVPQTKAILLVERWEFVRGCLALWLRDACPEFETIAAPNFERSLEAMSVSRIAAVVVTGETLQRMAEWFEGELARLRLRRLDVPVVALVAGDMISKTEEWVSRFGLKGYILNSSSTEVGSAALRLMMAGGSYFPLSHSHVPSGEQEAIGTTLGLPQNHLTAKLTLREQAVAGCLCRGAPNKIIAHELNMSLSTVKAHVHNIIQKLKVKNRTEVVVATRAAQIGSSVWTVKRAKDIC